MEGSRRNSVIFFAFAVLISALLLLGYQGLQPVGPSHFTVEIVNTYPHDATAFTQGLVYFDGLLYESTGLYGQSSVRVIDLDSGNVLEHVNISDTYFGEGMTILGDNIYQVTWKEGTGFVYSLALDELQSFTYHGEGWGLTHDGENLILSNGTNVLAFMDPETFEVVRTIDVIYDDAPVPDLNELEYVDGVIYANIWRLDQIIMIDPADGSTLGWIDLEGIEDSLGSVDGIDVLNGIAYNEETGRLLVTGKLWPNVFEVELVPK
jgi:glutamine cyclotransferase